MACKALPAISSNKHWWRSADPAAGGVGLCLAVGATARSLISLYFAAGRLTLVFWQLWWLLAVGGASSSPTAAHSQDVLLAKENDGAGATSSATAAAAPDFPPKFFILQRLLARSDRWFQERKRERERASERREGSLGLAWPADGAAEQQMMLV